MQAIVLEGKGVAFQEDFTERPKGTKNEIEVQVVKAGVCETDLQLMKGYMGFQGVLGHEFVGVATLGKYEGRRVVGEINCACNQCELCRAGSRNHCPNRSVIGILNHDGAFAERVFVPEENLHVLPDSVSNDQAVFVEPLAAAFQIQKQLRLDQFENAVVIGDGRLAFLIAQVLEQNNLCVMVVGKHKEKLARFSEKGMRVACLHSLNTVKRNYDLAVDCCGSETGIPTALRFLRPRGTLVLKTTIAGDRYPNLAGIVIDEINVVGSRCGPFDLAIDALANRSVEVESLITDRFSIRDGVEALQTAALPGKGKVIIEIGES